MCEIDQRYNINENEDRRRHVIRNIFDINIDIRFDYNISINKIFSTCVRFFFSIDVRNRTNIRIVLDLCLHKSMCAYSSFKY